MTSKFDIFKHLTDTFILTTNHINNYRIISDNHSGLITKIPNPDFNYPNLGSLDSNIIDELKTQNIPFICFPKETIESTFEDFMKERGLIKGDDVAANEFTNLQNWIYQPNLLIEIRKINNLEGL